MSLDPSYDEPGWFCIHDDGCWSHNGAYTHSCRCFLSQPRIKTVAATEHADGYHEYENGTRVMIPRLESERTEQS